MLAACRTIDNFDPTDIFSSEIFSTKKKLPGERRAVFPEGTPGVPQGVPPELIKGNQAAAEPETTQAVPEKKEAAAEPEKPKAKPKPKPKVAAKPAEPEGPADLGDRPPPIAEARIRRKPPHSRRRRHSRRPAGRAASRGGSIWPDPPR